MKQKLFYAGIASLGLLMTGVTAQDARAECYMGADTETGLPCTDPGDADNPTFCPDEPNDADTTDIPPAEDESLPM